MSSITGKVAIITGSTRGIGKATAQLLSNAGAKVVINSSKSVSEGEKLASELPNAFYVQANVADEKQCLDLVNVTLKKFGKIDFLINNTGISHRIPHKDFAAATDEIFYSMFTTNVMSAWYLSRATIPHLKSSANGNIINISSIAGSRAVGSSIPYAISKAALNQLTLLLANACSPDVRVNAIAPGLIMTPRTEQWLDAQTYHEERTALQKPGHPNDIAEMVLGIINSRYITGQVITVDGGFLLG